MTRYLVIGPQGSGKTTFGKRLAARLDTVCTDTSEWLVAVETKRLIDSGEGWKGWDPERGRPCRRLLVALGNAVVAVEPSCLVDRCFREGRVCSGVRRRAELHAARSLYPGVVVVWIDRAAGHEAYADNLELTAADADVVVAPEGEEGIEEAVARVLARG